MTPVLLSALMFLALEGARLIDPMLSFGIAIGGLLTSFCYLLAGRAALDATPGQGRQGGGDA